MEMKKTNTKYPYVWRIFLSILFFKQHGREIQFVPSWKFNSVIEWTSIPNIANHPLRYLNPDPIQQVVSLTSEWPTPTSAKWQPCGKSPVYSLSINGNDDESADRSTNPNRKLNGLAQSHFRNKHASTQKYLGQCQPSVACQFRRQRSIVIAQRVHVEYGRRREQHREHVAQCHCCFRFAFDVRLCTFCQS